MGAKLPRNSPSIQRADRRQSDGRAPRPAYLQRLSVIEVLEDRRMLAVDFLDFADALVTPLGDLQSAIDEQVGDLQLPLVGDKLEQIPPFHDAVRTALDDAIRTVDGLSGQAAEAALTTEIVDRLGPNGGLDVLANRAGPASIGAEDVDVTVDDANDTVDVTFDLDAQLVGLAVDFSVGLDALPFYLADNNGFVTADVSVGYQNFDVHFDAVSGIDFSGFADDVVTFSVGASLTSNLVDLQVGFLSFTAEDLGSSLGVNFSVDLSESGGGLAANIDSTSLTGNVDLLLHLETSIGSNFPNLSANFVLDWDFLNDGAPSVSFEDVSIGLGQFVSGLLSPVVERIEPILELVEPVLDVLTTDIPGLDQIGIDLSLLDIANIASGLEGVPPDLQAYLDVATTLVIAADLVTNIEAQDDQTQINFGTFDLSGMNGDLREVQAAVENPTPLDAQLTSFITGGGLDLAAIQNAIDGSPLPAGIKDQLSQVVMASQNGVAFDFPILNNPGAGIFKLLVGQDTELFEINAQFIPPVQDDQYNDQFGIPLLPGITGGLQGEVIPRVIARAGYDTFGLRNLIMSGDPADLLDGFYLGEETEFSLGGSVEAFVALKGPVFAAGLEGGLDLSLSAEVISSGEDPSLPDIDGMQHDKVRFKEFAGCAFQAAGGISFGIDAFVEIGIHVGPIFLGHRTDFDIVDIEILSFDTSCLADPFAMAEDPLLAELDPATGAVTLLVGPRAGDRNVEPAEINEVYEVRVIDPPGNPPAQGQVIEVKAFGRTQVIEGATSVSGDALNGNDSIKILEGPRGQRFEGAVSLGSAADGNKYFLSTATGFTGLTGGIGDDVLVGGFGQNLLVGNAGDDHILGGDNPGFENALLGGAGADVLIGGMGRNVIQGGGGNDEIAAGPGDDSIMGNGGNDIILAGAGNSTIDGGSEDDFITWLFGHGAINVLGGSGDDVIGFAGDLVANDTFILAPDNGAVRVMGHG